MNAVGIDISKGKCMVAILRPFGEVVASPFEIQHTAHELRRLVERLKSLDGETRIVMEHTGNYYLPVARHLHEAGLYVSVVNAILVHDYGQNSLRRVKTDKKDAVKIASYALSHWLDLPQYAPEEDVRHMLKPAPASATSTLSRVLCLKTASSLCLTKPFRVSTCCSPARPARGTVTKNGLTSWVNFGILNASTAFPKTFLPSAIKNGAKQQVTTFFPLRPLPSTISPAYKSVHCLEAPLPNSLLLKLCRSLTPYRKRWL